MWGLGWSIVHFTATIVMYRWMKHFAVRSQWHVITLNSCWIGKVTAKLNHSTNNNDRNTKKFVYSTNNDISLCLFFSFWLKWSSVSFVQFFILVTAASWLLFALILTRKCFVNEHIYELMKIKNLIQ